MLGHSFIEELLSFPNVQFFAFLLALYRIDNIGHVVGGNLYH